MSTRPSLTLQSATTSCHAELYERVGTTANYGDDSERATIVSCGPFDVAWATTNGSCITRRRLTVREPKWHGRPHSCRPNSTTAYRTYRLFTATQHEQGDGRSSLSASLDTTLISVQGVRR